MMQAKESNRTLRLVLGSLLYQAVWFLAVFSAGSSSRWWWSVVGTVLFLGFVLWAWPALRVRVLGVVAAATVCGLVVDSGMILGRVWVASPMVLPQPLPPIWLLMLWVSFGIYIALSLEMLYGRYWFSAVVGAIGGYLAYRGGVALGAIVWGRSVWVSSGIMLVVWAVAFPLLIRVATKLKR